jgi:hypothetical protein
MAADRQELKKSTKPQCANATFVQPVVTTAQIETAMASGAWRIAKDMAKREYLDRMATGGTAIQHDERTAAATQSLPSLPTVQMDPPRAAAADTAQAHATPTKRIPHDELQTDPPRAAAAASSKPVQAARYERVVPAATGTPFSMSASLHWKQQLQLLKDKHEVVRERTQAFNGGAFQVTATQAACGVVISNKRGRAQHSSLPCSKCSSAGGGWFSLPLDAEEQMRVMKARDFLDSAGWATIRALLWARHVSDTDGQAERRLTGQQLEAIADSSSSAASSSGGTTAAAAHSPSRPTREHSSGPRVTTKDKPDTSDDDTDPEAVTDEE